MAGCPSSSSSLTGGGAGGAGAAAAAPPASTLGFFVAGSAAGNSSLMGGGGGAAPAAAPRALRREREPSTFAASSLHAGGSARTRQRARQPRPAHCSWASAPATQTSGGAASARAEAERGPEHATAVLPSKTRGAATRCGSRAAREVQAQVTAAPWHHRRSPARTRRHPATCSLERRTAAWRRARSTGASPRVRAEAGVKLRAGSCTAVHRVGRAVRRGPPPRQGPNSRRSFVVKQTSFQILSAPASRHQQMAPAALRSAGKRAAACLRALPRQCGPAAGCAGRAA